MEETLSQTINIY
uniref:Uncharacterized protein n=1 Tax=Anguilla anguilla TaxID=7936 RepID=A0A0E9QMB2_ANGAN